MGAGVAVVVAGAFAAARMSDLVTRPSLPLPGIVETSTPVSSAALRAAGEIGCCESDEAGVVGVAAGAAAAGAGSLTVGVAAASAAAETGAAAVVLPAGAADSSMVATTWPISTSSSAATFREMIPATSALASEVILSVSSS